jgi:glycerol-3-phosphate dehydrogenase (NAD(P)+)
MSPAKRAVATPIDVSGPIGVLGAGSWGTAVAVHLARCGRSVVLCGRSDSLMRTIAKKRRNPTYLPAVEIPREVEATFDMRRLAACSVVVVAVPSHGYRTAVRELFAARAGKRSSVIVVSATKGIEAETLARMTEVTAGESRSSRQKVELAVLSGPTFAEELAGGSPTAAVIAASDARLAKALQGVLSGQNLRLYSSTDVVGVELGGAVKNVIAIASGVVSGLGLGHNTVAALITRGLSEMGRLGVACGGDAATFAGLAGLGDLVLTCTGALSRNRRAGESLAHGITSAQIERSFPTVAEGLRNAKTVVALARRLGVEMPICEQMELVLYHGKEPRRAVDDLMSRELKAEGDATSVAKPHEPAASSTKPKAPAKRRA